MSRLPRIVIGGLLALAIVPALADAAKRMSAHHALPDGVSSNLGPWMAPASPPGGLVGGARIEGGSLAEGDRRVRLDVVLRDPPADAAARLEGVGARVLAVSHRFGRASVFARASIIETMAQLPWVQHVYPEYGAVTAAGSVASRAPAALETGALTSGSLAALTGAGERIGIVSDSFARRRVGQTPPGVRDGDTTPAECNRQPATLSATAAQDSGDLPAAVELRADDAFFDADGDPATDDCPDSLGGTTLRDEGAAMAELIHDIAPGATLSFHTGFNGFASFAEAIADLCAVRPRGAGASIVVDDLQYLAELMYQPDAISQAVSQCVQGGTAYFSAAGNNGDLALRTTFRDFGGFDDEGRNNGQVFPLDARDFHDWGGLDPYLRVDVPPGAGFSAVLQWNQPALSVPQNERNGPRVDLDLFVLEGPSETAAPVSGSSGVSAQDQRADRGDAGADPIEIVQVRNDGSQLRSFYVVVDHWAGNQERIPQGDGTPLEFRLVFFQSGPGVRVEQTGSGAAAAGPAIYGHAVADGAISVGAVPWFEAAPAFDASENGTAGIDPEPFSSRGGTLQRHFRADGSFRIDSTPTEPDLAAVDGNNTTFFGNDLPAESTDQDGEPDGLPNFFGTSAAAPNAAGVAALLREGEPSLAPGELESRLKTGARDVTGERAAPGCDAVTGAGLIDAAAAFGADNEAPVAEAGPDDSARGGDRVTLDGSASTDDAAIAAYRWTQVRGPRVPLTSAGTARPTFTAPNRNAMLVFELRVQDDGCLAAFDRVGISIRGGGGGGGGGDDDDGGGALGVLALLGLALALVGSRRRVKDSLSGVGTPV